ncbi:MAG: efflux RND transporter periplasmic adaptor subunit [Pirellulales bacterium]|nr:efflux RND transporter periplasmic adaptor subunit [Pirellulales bacterium]
MIQPKSPAHGLFIGAFRWSLLICCGCAVALTCLVAYSQSKSSVGQRPTDLPTMIYEGFTEPRHDIMVAAAEIGRLERLDVEVGDPVEAGQVIGQLEDTLQQASVRIARQQASMTGEWKAASAEVKMNEASIGKVRELARDGMVRPDELRRAEADLQIALARKQSAEEQLQLRKLELERYELQLARRKIRSPMKGIISEVFHQPSEYITPGDPAIVRLLVMDKLFAVFNIPVEDIGQLKLGAPVRVYLRSSGAALDAQVSSIAPDIHGESGTVQVRVELDNRGGRLLSGDRCTLQLLSKPPRPGNAARPRQRQGAIR